DSGGVPKPQTGTGPVERDSGGVPKPQAETPQPAAAPASEEASATAPAEAPRSEPPAWAKSMRRHQAMVHGATVATHTLRGGDSRGPGASVSVTDKE
ncbi:MAG: hypothetical protein KYX69_18455, partial [Sphingomonas sp.]|nr:hypothetical protein [Sphingomonas sp.]